MLFLLVSYKGVSVDPVYVIPFKAFINTPELFTKGKGVDKPRWMDLNIPVSN